MSDTHIDTPLMAELRAAYRAAHMAYGDDPAEGQLYMDAHNEIERLTRALSETVRARAWCVHCGWEKVCDTKLHAGLAAKHHSTICEKHPATEIARLTTYAVALEKMLSRVLWEWEEIVQRAGSWAEHEAAYGKLVQEAAALVDRREGFQVDARPHCEPMHAVTEDGWTEWIHPLPGYLMQCCDCGLVHELEIAIVKDRVCKPDGTFDGDFVTDPALDVLFRMRRPPLVSTGPLRPTWARWTGADAPQMSAETTRAKVSPGPCVSEVAAPEDHLQTPASPVYEPRRNQIDGGSIPNPSPSGYLAAESSQEDSGSVGLGPNDDEYMCPNCVTPWKCNGPHYTPTESHAMSAADTLRAEGWRLVQNARRAVGDHYIRHARAAAEKWFWQHTVELLGPPPERNAVSASEDCPDALMPDGPVCPRCGGPRGPSGVDGGSWVHYPRADKKPAQNLSEPKA